jgi:hypothetical protein
VSVRATATGVGRARRPVAVRTNRAPGGRAGSTLVGLRDPNPPLDAYAKPTSDSARPPRGAYSPYASRGGPRVKPG